MSYLNLNHPNRSSFHWSLTLVSFIIICFLGWLWGWKTSGVLENTMTFDANPLGYSFLLETQGHGIWPINREAVYYLNGMQAFLGVPETNINLGNGYEITRTLYCLLLRSFWFLEPIVASFVLDIILWFLAALSAAYIVGTFSKNKYAPWLAAMLVVFGQGFLHSVGEGIPHVLGYVGGFYVGALICFFRTWDPKCRYSEDLVVYVFLGLWQIGYGTALFFLPLALLSTIRRLRMLNAPLNKVIITLASLSFVSLLPFCLLTLIAKVITRMPGEMDMVLNGMKILYPTALAYLMNYASVFLDGLLSLGPIIVLATIVLFYSAICEKDQDTKYLALAFFLPYMGMIFLITPLVGRGYATFNLILIPMIFLILRMESAIKSLKANKIGMVLIMILIALYPNSMKLGFLLPNKAFHAGWYQDGLSKVGIYETYVFQ